MEVGDVGASGGLHSARCRSLRKDHSIISGNLEFSHSVEINDRVTSLSHVVAGVNRCPVGLPAILWFNTD